MNEKIGDKMTHLEFLIIERKNTREVTNYRIFEVFNIILE